MSERIVVKSEEEWLKIRKENITATEMASLLGVDPYRSMNKAWTEKHTGTFTGNSYTKVGQLLEPVVVEVVNYVMELECDIWDGFRLFEQTKDEKVLYVDHNIGISATPDAFLEDKHIVLLECKTTKPDNYLKYSGYPPEKYLVQLLCQMMCTGSELGYLAIMSTDLSPKNFVFKPPVVVYRMYADSRIESLMRSEATRFWDCFNNKKTFKVDHKVKAEVRLLLQTLYERIY